MAKRRRGAGEGSIYKRADGRWCAHLTVGFDENGAPQRRYLYGKTRREVAEKLGQLQHDARTGPLPRPERTTLGVHLDLWLKAKRPNLSANTAELYAGLIANHLKPRLGGLALRVLDADHVQSVLTAMEEDGKGARVRQQTLTLLRAALDTAARRRLIGHNPAALVDRPRHEATERRALTAAQARALLDAIGGHRLEALFALAIGMGLRQGELFGLAWRDFDEAARTLSVRQKVMDVNGTPVLTTTLKSKAARRTLPLPGFCVEALARHRTRLGAIPHPDRLLFTDRRGGLLRKSNFARREWAELREAAELPADLTFHELRHTFVTLLSGERVPLKTAQAMAGHSRPETTLRHYTHAIDGEQERAAEALDAILGDGAEG